MCVCGCGWVDGVDDVHLFGWELLGASKSEGQCQDHVIVMVCVLSTVRYGIIPYLLNAAIRQIQVCCLYHK